jgi:predicted ribosomally synthesized peptide with SipW-like signal peptide
MSTRRIAIFLASGGAALALIGTGVAASFTDSATATANIKVGTFGIAISSTTPTAVISGKTVTLNCPDIATSAAGSCALNFTVTNTGTIPASVTVVATSLSAPFSDMFVNPGAETLGASGFTYNGGIQWTTLSNANLGQSVTITYTINAVG